MSELGMKLKSCPFCGATPQLWSKLKHPYDIEIWYLACVNVEFCVVQPGIMYGYSSEQNIITAWNKRFNVICEGKHEHSETI